MRKRTVNYVADTIFWYLIYFLPVLIYLLYNLSLFNSVNLIPLDTFFNTVGFTFLSDNIVFNTFVDIFGAGGLIPIFDNTGIFYVLTWFVCTLIAHLFVDFLLFIPRLCHKWLKSFTLGD